ncbi:hypothetical protein DNF23_42795 [Pseudomonas syringae pv. pisi]|nr:hypothetical protein AL062_25280 [Pseudomonas syringae pv. syringae]PBP48596.1 hypothetical protein CCL11_06895 [Pseudomonas syringae]RXT68135.1 hypothetical protein B1F74_02190 [Pseudomonas syringae]
MEQLFFSIHVSAVKVTKIVASERLSLAVKRGGVLYTMYGINQEGDWRYYMAQLAERTALTQCALFIVIGSQASQVR